LNYVSVNTSEFMVHCVFGNMVKSKMMKISISTCMNMETSECQRFMLKVS